MAEAYCPYCGVEIATRGQSQCDRCGGNIIDIWKLLNSELPAETPRRILPPLSPFVWIARLIFAGMLFVLIVTLGYYVYSHLLDLVQLQRSGVWNSPLDANFSDSLTRLRTVPMAAAVISGWLAPPRGISSAAARIRPDSGAGQGCAHD